MYEHTARSDPRRATTPGAPLARSLAVHATHAGNGYRHAATRHHRDAQPCVRIAS